MTELSEFLKKELGESKKIGLIIGYNVDRENYPYGPDYFKFFSVDMVADNEDGFCELKTMKNEGFDTWEIDGDPISGIGDTLEAAMADFMYYLTDFVEMYNYYDKNQSD